MEDNRTMKELAREALQVQDACNLSGVVHGYARAMSRLRKLLESEGRASTDAVNRHRIAVMWASKVESLTALDFEREHEAFRWAHEVTKEGAAA